MRLLPFLFLGATVLPSFAELKLPALFSDKMVLQQGMDVPVWGWADPGAEISVTFAGQTEKTKVPASGKFELKLKPLEASAQERELTVTSSSKETLVIKEVVVGEVWLGSGQSNMQWTINKVSQEQQKLAKEKDRPNLRIFFVPLKASYEPQEDVQATWKKSLAADTPAFSAVAWAFGNQLQQELNVPVGMITSSWGGSRIEPWISDQAFAENPMLKAIAETRQKQKEAKKLKLNNHGYGLYQAMIHPLQPYALRGFLWYQGESNVADASKYLEMKRSLIEGWRKDWQQPDAPFLYVQLAPFTYEKNRVGKLPLMWEAQEKCLEIPHTGMAVINDVGNLKNIHPLDKLTVGKRLAGMALNMSYGKKDLVANSPRLKKVSRTEDGLIVLSFDHLGEGLMMTKGDQLTHFELVFPNGSVVPVAAQISEDGQNILIKAEKADEAVEVRFAWSNTAEPNLANSAGLPASAFRRKLP